MVTHVVFNVSIGVPINQYQSREGKRLKVVERDVPVERVAHDWWEERGATAECNPQTRTTDGSSYENRAHEADERNKGSVKI